MGCIKSPVSRDALPALFEALGYTRGVEIGVERGHYTKTLLTDTTFSLIAVDAWKAYRGYREHVSQTRLDDFHVETKERLKAFDMRVSIEKGWSVDVAKTVPDKLMDFVYIDGNHTLPQVIADLHAWIPKVKPGGIIAGHDYRKFQHGYPCHVIEAVSAWHDCYGEPEKWWLTMGDKSPSYLWVKP
jgi:hypothetical protein